MRVCYTLSSAVACVLLIGGCGKFTYTAKISREKIQSKVDPMFPVDMQAELDLPFPATLSQAEVVLAESSDVIGMRLRFSADPPEPALPVPRAPRPPPFAPPGAPAPPADLPPAGKRIDGVVELVGEVSYVSGEGAFYFTNPTVRDFEASDLPPELAEPLSRGAAKLVGAYLAQHPIYNVDDSKLLGKLAKALLRSVEVRDGTLQVKVGF